MEERRRRDDAQIQVLTAQFVTLVAQIDKDERKAEEWRGRICKKLDDLLAKVEVLPCAPRAEITKSLTRDVTWLQRTAWAIIIAGVPSLLGLAAVWGEVRSSVTKTEKWIEKYEEKNKISLEEQVINWRTHK